MLSTDWFCHARFGMFLHWGLYSLPAVHEWLRSQQRITTEDYQIYFDTFTAERYDPKAWARAAKAAGMRYMVLTAKHHDGFCLFDSRLTEYKATNTPAGRDLVREFVEAVRAEGLKVGLYYSLLDWHHPDYPKYGDRIHPMRGNEAYANDRIEFDRYLKYMHGQVEELCRDYGKIDILWFDFAYDDLKGEAWKASELIRMVRGYQPDVIIDNRLEGDGDKYGSLVTENPAPFSGDFVCPEHHVPEQGIRKPDGSPVPWELCTTLNDHWCYSAADKNYKSKKLLIRTLTECVSKGGNMILNVGPMADGRFPEESQRILNEIGDWMQDNFKSIYGCGPSGIPKPDWGRYTRNGNKVYAHVFEEQIGALGLFGIEPEKVAYVRKLSDGVFLPACRNAFGALSHPDVYYVSFGKDENCTYELPDGTDTVLEITLKEEV